MYSGIRQLCAMSLLCGAALTMTPEGGVKRVTQVLCTAVLVITVLSPLKALDIDDLALAGARLHEAERELFGRGEAAEERLNRLVIEREYEAYIMDKAESLGLELSELSIRVQWSLEGYWAPYGAELRAEGDRALIEELGRILRDDLGIPYERQQWNGHE